MIYNFTTEELIPVVAYLSEKFTGGESSSITYDRARGLMGAVIYCIKEAERYDKNSLATNVKPSAKELYEIGYERVIEKTRKTSQKYNELAMNFKDYGNEFYHDTVLKGLPEFFIHYDARFAPQDHLLTLDYPILQNYPKLTGIDLVEKYINCICLEQKYLDSFAEGVVYDLLNSYDYDYREVVDNIALLVLRKQLERDYYEDLRSLNKSRLTKDIWFCLTDNGMKEREIFLYLSKSLEYFANLS